MADAESALPVRSEADGSNALLRTRIVDATNNAQLLSVDSLGNAQEKVHGNDPSSTDRILKLSEMGNANADGIYDAANNTKPSKNGVIAHVRNATPADANQTLRVTAIQGSSPNTAYCMDMALHDNSGNPYTSTNPLPVYTAPAAGTAVMDSFTYTSVAAGGGTATHSYPISAGTTLFELGFLVAVSARFKWVIDFTLDGSTYTTLATVWTSAAAPTVAINFVPEQYPIVGSATTALRITCTNTEPSGSTATDAYSTSFGTLR